MTQATTSLRRGVARRWVEFAGLRSQAPVLKGVALNTEPQQGERKEGFFLRVSQCLKLHSAVLEKKIEFSAEHVQKSSKFMQLDLYGKHCEARAGRWGRETVLQEVGNSGKSQEGTLRGEIPALNNVFGGNVRKVAPPPQNEGAGIDLCS